MVYGILREEVKPINRSKAYSCERFQFPLKADKRPSLITFKKHLKGCCMKGRNKHAL